MKPKCDNCGLPYTVADNERANCVICDRFERASKKCGKIRPKEVKCKRCGAIQIICQIEEG